MPTEPETYLYGFLLLLLVTIWALAWKYPVRCTGCGQRTSSPTLIEIVLCPPCAVAHHGVTYADATDDDDDTHFS